MSAHRRVTGSAAATAAAGPAERPRWRLIVEPAPLDGAANMAVDHALLDAVLAGADPVLRFYRWEPGCLSFGRNQAVRGLYDERRARAAGVDLVRRPTGGLAVYHHHELTYAVVAPVGALGSPRESYFAINRALVAGLRALGVDAAIASGTASASPSASAPLRPDRDAAFPCFRAAAPGEVVVGARKLVGSAQRCERRTLLQHGSILLAGHQEPVADLVASGGAGRVPVIAADPVALADVLPEPPAPGALAASLARGFALTTGAALEDGALTAQERARARALRDRYRSPDWTWRR